MLQTRVGISGWRYRPWKNDFYPKELKSCDELSFVSENLNSVEINGSFYSLRTPKNYRTWYESTADDFIFSVKGSRYITHTKRLKNISKPLANFFASGVLALEEKLGPFLWQFPPSMKFEPELFEKFFALLPKDTLDATILARRHDDKVKGRAKLSVKENFKLRHAIEVRNESFNTPAFFELLRKYNLSLVMSDAGDKWPYFEELTSDFIYIRLHGKQELYQSGYSYQALNAWKRKIRNWQKKKMDVYVYFDNDAKVYAPFNAMYLLDKLTGLIS